VLKILILLLNFPQLEGSSLNIAAFDKKFSTRRFFDRQKFRGLIAALLSPIPDTRTPLDISDMYLVLWCI